MSSLQAGSFHTRLISHPEAFLLFLMEWYGSLVGDYPPTSYPPVKGSGRCLEEV